MWQMVIGGIVLVILGIIEGYAAFHYVQSKATKSVPTAPMVIYSSVAVSVVLVGVGMELILGRNPIFISHRIYAISGIALVIVALLIFRRGYQAKKKLKRSQNRVKIYQTYWIALMILITGIVNLFIR